MPTPSRLDPVVATRCAGQPPSWSLSIDEARTASQVVDPVFARVKRADDETRRPWLDDPGLGHGFVQFAGALPTARVAAALRDASTTAASSEDTP